MYFSLHENMCSVREHCVSGIATVTKGGRVLRTVNSLRTNLYSSISCIKKLIYSTFLVHEDEEVI